MSLHYSSLKNTELKATSVTKIHKFWDAELKSMGVTYTGGEPGVKATIEQIGADHFLRAFQPYALDSDGAVTEGYQVFSLGELAESKQQEAELVQFDVISSRVDAFLTEPKMGLIATHTLYEPILVVELPDGNAIIGGGRHRATGLLTLYKLIEGWQDISVACVVRQVNSIDEAVNVITASNGSRTMTATEKAQLTSARRGITVVRSADEIVEQLNNLTAAADHKNVAMLYYVTRGQDELTGITNDTLGKIGNAVVGKLIKSINTLGKGAALKVLNFKGGDGNKVARLLIEYSFDVMVETWDALLDSIKEPIKDRKSGGNRVDEFGEVVYSINVARNTASIADDVAESVFAELEAKLATIFDTALKAEAEAKAAAETQKVAKKATTQVKQVESAMDYLAKMGISLTPEQEAMIQATKAEAEAKAKQLADQPAQGSSVLNSELEALLG
jgi:hypothetical protein